MNSAIKRRFFKRNFCSIRQSPRSTVLYLTTAVQYQTLYAILILTSTCCGKHVVDAVNCAAFSTPNVVIVIPIKRNRVLIFLALALANLFKIYSFNSLWISCKHGRSCHIHPGSQCGRTVDFAVSTRYLSYARKTFNEFKIISVDIVSCCR